jgi:hypothetical protein
MADVTVHFVNPTDERVLTVTLDDTITAGEAINELLANDFIPHSLTGYQLNVHRPNSGENETEALDPDQTLAAGGVVNKTRIRVNPATGAGMIDRRAQ